MYTHYEINSSMIGTQGVSYEIIAVVIAIAIALVILIVIKLNAKVTKLNANPFDFPYMYIKLDVSGVKNPNILDEIDRYLLRGGYEVCTACQQEAKEWLIENKNIVKNIQRKKLQAKRIEQLKNTCDFNHLINFSLIRYQTRYKQENYIRTPYKVQMIIGTCRCSYKQLRKRYNLLVKLGKECTINEYNSQKQRNLLTKQLREAVMQRDNYTCQICGKYMPDKVGLNIDHIIPVSKGGKSIKSNLQVLCNICNGRKGNKTINDYIKNDVL